MTETETTEIGQKQLRKTSKNMSETHPTGNIAHQDGGEGDTQSSDYNESDEEVDTKCKCHECGLGYKDTPDQRWLYCAICNNIFDINCQKISKTRHDSLKHENCFWICTPCKLLYKPDPKKGINFQAAITPMDKRIVQIEKDTTAITRQTAELVSDISKIHTMIKSTLEGNLKSVEDRFVKEIAEVPNKIEASTKWADVLKSPPIPSATDLVQNFKQALTEMSAKDKEMETRSRGIVIYRAKESESNLKEERKRHDEKLVQDLLNHLEMEDVFVVSTDRLGRPDPEREKEGKYRPIKVRFNEKRIRDEVLKNLNKLKNAEASLRKLSIRQDLDEAQRNELNSKLKRAYDMTKASNTHIYRVRGNPGEYSIKEFLKADSPRQ